MPKCLDLFCGHGGAAMGYNRAGFTVTGIDNDIRLYHQYPYEFRFGNAMTAPLDGYDFIHASPPCKDHTPLRNIGRGYYTGTGWMLQATIDRLAEWGGPWVVENVAGAHMPGSITLCGTEFGLGADGLWLKRHRQFLSNVPLKRKGQCLCARRRIAGVYGNSPTSNRTRGRSFGLHQARIAMEMPGVSWKGMTQAIPPAYTEWIGLQILEHLSRFP